jgi:hypothetical protein
MVTCLQVSLNHQSLRVLARDGPRSFRLPVETNFGFRDNLNRIIIRVLLLSKDIGPVVFQRLTKSANDL